MNDKYAWELHGDPWEIFDCQASLSIEKKTGSQKVWIFIVGHMFHIRMDGQSFSRKHTTVFAVIANCQVWVPVILLSSHPRIVHSFTYINVYQISICFLIQRIGCVEFY